MGPDIPEGACPLRMTMLSELNNTTECRLGHEGPGALRVLALTNLYPNLMQPQRGTFNRNQLKILHEQHCPVRVIAPISWTDEYRARLANKPRLPANRRVELDGLTIDHPRVYHAPRFLRSWYGRFYYWSVRKTFLRVCQEFKPTIVYAPWIYPDGWAAIKLAKEVGLPVVIKALGSDVLELTNNPGRRAGTVEALKAANGLLAVSQHLVDAMIDLGASADKMRVVYCGLDLNRFCPGSQAQAREKVKMQQSGAQLLFIGNLVPVKGIDVLIKACALLQAAGLDFHLHLVGEGPLRQQLANLAQSLKVAARLHWHGSIPQADLPDWYRAADLFVLASRSEGVPNVLLEASGCNTPWVATRVGGIPEIAHLGVNRIVAPESPDELSKAMQAALAAPPGIGALPRKPEAAVAETVEFLAQIQARYLKSKLGL